MCREQFHWIKKLESNTNGPRRGEKNVYWAVDTNLLCLSLKKLLGSSVCLYCLRDFMLTEEFVRMCVYFMLSGQFVRMCVL